MIELIELLHLYMNTDLEQVILSSPRKDGPIKVRIRPILLQERLRFQCTQTVGAQELHSNHDTASVIRLIGEYMTDHFKQLQLFHGQAVVNALVSKKGKVTIKCKKREEPTRSNGDLSHNRKKRYILNPEKKVGFLVDLGVMTTDGKIVKARYDKFRQINRFLEFIEDVLWKLPKDREITIVDFGCGKSYLTFAIYHYLKELKGYDVRILGLDLKEDVINHCNRLAAKYGYEKLHFHQGDIADCDFKDHVDMVVSLHACDTATDYALLKAVSWGASVILTAPCCQHELNGQMKNDILHPVLSYGVIKERMAALFTDGLRAGLLEEQGYETQVLEFVDMDHTPKNLLIRAVKSVKRRGESKELRACMEFLQVSPTLDTLLKQLRK